MRTVIRFIMLLLTAVVLQRFLFDQFRIVDIAADAFLVLAVATGVVCGARQGAIIGFCAGLIFDLLVVTPFGLGALSYLVAGAVGGLLEGVVVHSARWITMLVAFIASAAGVLFFALLGSLIGTAGMTGGHLVTVTILVAGSTSVLVLPTRRVVKWASSYSDPLRAAVHS